MKMFSNQYYDRKSEEKIFSYLCRIIPAFTILYLIVGMPTVIGLCFLLDEPNDSIMFHIFVSYIYVIIGAPIWLMFRDWFVNRRRKKKYSN
jgi:O-antigen/teichoic acid export membrane protein